jgi:hypothetical protein
MNILNMKRAVFVAGLFFAAMIGQAQQPALVTVTGGPDRFICDIFRSGRCIGAQYDSGTVTVTISGTNYSVIYGKTSTAAGLAAALAGRIPGATVSGSTIAITSNDFANFSLSASVVSSDPVTFGGSAFGVSTADPGVIFPKYVVLSVLYAPPGSQSFVDYLNTVMVGSASSWSKSFTNSASITVGFSSTVPILGSANSMASAQWSQTAESDGSISVEKSSSLDIRLPGPADSMLGIDHDFDVVYIWLNPRADFYVTAPNVANWRYSFDQRDPVNEMDVIPLYVSQLKDPTTINDPNIITRLAKIWDTSGIGGLTSADLLAIAQRDPFWNLGTTQPGTVDATRFDLQGGETFPYVPPPQGGQPITTTFTETYQTTSVQGRSATDDYTVAYSRAGDVNFFGFLQANLILTNALTWENKWTSQTSQSSTQTSTFSITGPPFGYTGKTNVQLYKDNIYGTFLPNFN